MRAAAPERLGQTMGAAEVGRELGDAGGPLLVGAVAAAARAGQPRRSSRRSRCYRRENGHDPGNGLATRSATARNSPPVRIR
ncbi:MAG: hypothetical protein ACRDUW_27030 [Pseudonocardiaceae bacterium]